MGKKTLVIGATTNSSKYAYRAIQQLQIKGHTVRAIGRRKEKVLGVKIHRTKRKFKGIDTVTLYLNKNNQREYYNYILELEPKRVLFNPGTINPEFEDLLAQHNIPFERVCTLVLLSIGEY